MIKRKTCTISLSEQHLKKLQELSEIKSMNKSVIIQILIDKEYESLKRNK